MEAIFHEKQEGALCAQHCLNSLLQGPYFNAVDLASIAKDLDEVERQRMAEGNVNGDDYLNFMQQPSSNMDDTGYFSIQVICKALEVWNLEMLPYNSPLAEEIRSNPCSQSAFICNQQNHWLSIRKIGGQWFNLNSIKAYPQLISDTYLSLLLAQLQMEGYSIFIVVGILPDCEAHQLLTMCPVSQDDYKLFVEKERAKNKNKSKTSNGNHSGGTLNESNETITDPVDETETYVTADETAVRNKRLKYFEKLQQKSEDDPKKNISNEKEDENKSACNDLSQLSEEDMLKIAMEMSMQQSIT